MEYKGEKYYTVKELASKIITLYCLESKVEVPAVEKKIKRIIEDENISYLKIKESSLSNKSESFIIEYILIDYKTGDSLIRSDSIRKYAIKQMGRNLLSDAEIYFRQQETLDNLLNDYNRMIKKANLEGYVDDSSKLTKAQFLELDKISGRNEYLQPQEVLFLMDYSDEDFDENSELPTVIHGKGGLIKREELNDYERFLVNQYNSHIHEEEEIANQVESLMKEKKTELMLKQLLEQFGYSINEKLLKEDVINYVHTEAIEGYNTASNIYEIDNAEAPIKIEEIPSQDSRRSFLRLRKLDTKDYIINNNKD